MPNIESRTHPNDSIGTSILLLSFHVGLPQLAHNPHRTQPGQVGSQREFQMFVLFDRQRLDAVSLSPLSKDQLPWEVGRLLLVACLELAQYRTSVLLSDRKS